MRRRKALIYLLTDPADDAVYVGRTFRAPITRWREHCKRHRRSWEEPVVLERVSALRWYEAEMFWIQYLRFIGAVVVNVRVRPDDKFGGGSPTSYSLEWREAQAARTRSYWANPEHRAVRSVAIAAGTKRAGQRASLRQGRSERAKHAWRTGRREVVTAFWTEERRAQAGAVSRERQAAPEVRRKRIEATTYTREELLSALRKAARTLGHTPRVGELGPKHGWPAVGSFVKRFGSMADAVRLIGLTPNKTAQRSPPPLPVGYGA